MTIYLYRMFISKFGTYTEGSSGSSSGSSTNAMAGFVRRAGDAMHGILSLGGNRITDLSSPIGTYDAANKKYVDAQDATIKNYVDTREDLKLNRAGDTMTGVLNMNNRRITNLPSPDDPNDAVTKSYVDSHKPKVDIYKVQNVTTESTVTLSLRPATGSSTESINLPAGIYRFTITGTTPFVEDSPSRGDVELWVGDGQQLHRTAAKTPHFQLVIILFRHVDSMISLKAKCTSSDRPLGLAGLALIIETLEQ